MFTDVLTNSSANICITAGDDGVAACATDAAAAVPASPIDAPASICMYVYIYIMMIALYCSCRNKYMYKYIAFVARRGQMPQHQHPNALVGKLLMPLLMHIFWLNAATLKADTRNTTGACMGAARPRQRR